MLLFIFSQRTLNNTKSMLFNLMIIGPQYRNTFFQNDYSHDNCTLTFWFMEFEVFSLDLKT